MRKLKIALSVSFVLIIAISLRAYQLENLPPGLYPDEAINGNNALAALNQNNFRVFYPENNGREGLFINIQALTIKFVRLISSKMAVDSIPIIEPWVLRVPSVIFGALTVLGLYFLGLELFGARTGLLASFFLATSFWHINFSRIGFRAIMAPMFLVWGIYFLLIALRKTRTYHLSPITCNLFAALAGAVYGLGMHSYIAYRATPIIILFIIGYCLWTQKEKTIRKKIFLSAFCFLLTTFLVVSPLLLYFAQNPTDFLGRISQISIFNSKTLLNDLGLNTLKTLGMFNFVGDGNWRHNYAGRPQLFWPVGIMFVIGILRGILSVFRRVTTHYSAQTMPGVNGQTSNVLNVKFEFWILFIWFFAAMLPVVISNESLPHALRAILMIPPVMLFAATGGIWFYDLIRNSSFGLRNSKWFPLASATFLIILTFEGYYTYFEFWGKNSNVRDAFAANYLKLGRELNILSKEKPKYVVVKTGGMLVNNIPMSAQTVMFITDTYLPEKQMERNIYYVVPKDENDIPKEALKFYLE